MDQTVTTRARMRGNVGGLRDATRELGPRSPRCSIKRFGNNTPQRSLRDAVPQMCVSPLSLSVFLHHMASVVTERLIYSTARSASTGSESKFRCQASSITLCYQISIDDWLFNFAAQQSLIQRSAPGSAAADLAP